MRGVHAVECQDEYLGSLGDRMKVYESMVGTMLDKGYPVIVRVDGKSDNYNRTFNNEFNYAMVHTARRMCEELQGCKIAYGQSDELTIMLTAYENPASDLFFGGQVQKIVSNVASIATDAFSEYMDIKRSVVLDHKMRRSRFGVRCFNLPFIEVNNYFFWRQCEAKRNTIQALGKSPASGITWDNIPARHKVGFCVRKRTVSEGPRKWDVDVAIPDFRQNKEYINSFFDEILLT